MRMEERGWRNEEPGRGTQERRERNLRGRASGVFLVGVEDNRSIGGVKSEAKRQDRRPERKSDADKRTESRSARQERWKEGSGAGMDAVADAGTAAVAAAGTRAGTDAVSGPGTDVVAGAGTRAVAAPGPVAVAIRGPGAVQGAGAAPEGEAVPAR